AAVGLRIRVFSAGIGPVRYSKSIRLGGKRRRRRRGGGGGESLDFRKQAIQSTFSLWIALGLVAMLPVGIVGGRGWMIAMTVTWWLAAAAITTWAISRHRKEKTKVKAAQEARRQREHRIREQSELRQRAEQIAYSILNREGWTLAARCRTCGRK